MRELEVQKELPVIKTNYEEVKISLVETVNKYKGMVVTEDTLKDCKATQKELASLRTKIDTYRKDVKRVIEAPIKNFESKCKELISLVEEAENPIKEGIKVFDDKRREDKKVIAEKLIKNIITEYEISEEYASELTILDSYVKLTAKPSEVKNDLEKRALLIKQKQNEVEEKKKAVIAAIDNANKDINRKLQCSEFERYIKNYSLVDILNKINQSASMIKEAENPKIVEVVEEAKEPISIPVDITEKNHDPLCFVSFRIEAPKSRIAELSKLLNDNGFAYDTIDKGYVKY